MISFSALKNKLSEEVAEGKKDILTALHELEVAVRDAFDWGSPAPAEDMPAGASVIDPVEVGLANAGNAIKTDVQDVIADVKADAATAKADVAAIESSVSSAETLAKGITK